MLVTNRQTAALVILGLLAAVLIYLGSSQEQSRVQVPPATEATVEVRPVPPPLPELPEADYFVEYRLERDRVRSQEIEILQEIVNNQNFTAEARQEAQHRLLALTQIMDQELELEAVMEAKGFPESMLFIRPDSVTVIVRAAKLQPEEAAQIADLVSRGTGQPAGNIVIVPRP